MKPTADRYYIKTLGCKANLYDSQLIETELQKRGWAPAADEDHPDIRLMIVNSCTVTNEAERQSRKAAEKLARHSQARIVMTGCSAEADPEALTAVPGLHYIIGNRDKPTLVDRVLKAIEDPLPESGAAKAKILGRAQGYTEMVSRHPIDREWPLPDSLFDLPSEKVSRRTRAFLKVQEGCNSFCTFCVIPYGRGPSRSLPLQEVLNRVNELVAQGAQETLLTGTNLGDYGADQGGPSQIENLCEEILLKTPIKRLRLTSLDPSEISPRLIELMKAHQPRFSAHFHVSLQSPHSQILKLMKRQYRHEEVVRCLQALQAASSEIGRGVFVGMDVITGFPGETDEIFEESFQMLKGLSWSRLHVFPYSERSGTPATRLPGAVEQSVRKQRARRLMALSLERMRTHYLNEKREVLGPVLIERPVKGPTPDGAWVSAYTDHYIRCLVQLESVEQARALNNQWVSVKPQKVWIDEPASDVAWLCSVSNQKTH